MTMTKHTPGPWSFSSNLRENGIARIMPSYRQRVCIATIPAGKNADAKEADARLIAAAPELLSQLEFAVALLKPMFEHTAQVERMEDAITKATGGEPCQ